MGDLLKMGEMALSALIGAGNALGAKAVESRDAIVRNMDLVTREEFDAAFAMLRKIRTAQTQIEARLNRLEKAKPLSTPAKPSKKKQSSRK